MLRSAYVGAVTLWREYSQKGRAISRKRAATEMVLDRLARSSQARFDGTVLIDGMWDNPNFWLRYSLLRAALGLAHGREVGLLGQFRHRQNRATFERLGVREVYRLGDVLVPDDVTASARELVRATNSADDVLRWKLPYDVHPTIVYDGILKRQRLETLDIRHPNFESDTIDGLTAISQSAAVLDRVKPDLVVVTHPFNFNYGSLAWIALSRGIPVVLVFGVFGALRFTRMAQCEDLFRFYDRPSREDIDSLPPAKADAMAEVGRAYVAGRLQGRADDLPSIYAFQRNADRISREDICREFHWDRDKPIVAFYASNWFDWPHQLGMTQFRDFLDWTEASFEVAHKNASVNWLFKPHPAEEWFGGVSLKEILSRYPNTSHIGIAPKGWNNAAVMQAIDALVTYHGTAGIEFASLGKPVLLPDRGKYDDCGFARVAYSRDEYLQLLATEWWRDLDAADVRRRAEIFAGWWFCAPQWQGGFVLPDDSRQDALYDTMSSLIESNKEAVRLEIEELAIWWNSGRAYYHTSKMLRADRFQLSNLF